MGFLVKEGVEKGVYRERGVSRCLYYRSASTVEMQMCNRRDVAEIRKYDVGVAAKGRLQWTGSSHGCNVGT